MAKHPNTPISKPKPDEQSLNFAEQIARVQGLPFDRDATEKLGTELYEVMFGELIDALDLDEDAPDFHSGVYPSARAFAAVSPKGRAVVALDMVFDFWLVFMHQIVGVCTFSAPSRDEQRRIARDANSLFELFRDSRDFGRVREPLSFYMLEPAYAEIIRITNLMGRASLVFVLCHELAHGMLDHHSVDPHPDQEMEADREAAKMFKRVVQLGQIERLGHIHIDPKVMCAPIVFTMILELFEAWLTAQGADLTGGSHPPASERTAQLQRLLQDEFNDVAQEIIVGSTYAIAELHTLLGLERPEI